MSAHSDLGPQGPTRMEVCLLASEIVRMASLARELCGLGPGLDVARAVRTLRKAHDLLDQMIADHEASDADGR